MEENNDSRQAGAIDGLIKLACGRINDAVRLAIDAQELDAKTISELDLFGVSEIKINKDGGLDIKFYDRLKALELLLAATITTESSAANSFFGALESAAKSVCDSDAV